MSFKIQHCLIHVNMNANTCILYLQYDLHLLVYRLMRLSCLCQLWTQHNSCKHSILSVSYDWLIFSLCVCVCVSVCVCVCVCVHEICLQSLREALETGFTNLTTLKMSQNPIGDNGMLQVRCAIITSIHTLFLFLSCSPSICMNIYPVPFFFLALFLACRSQYPSLVFCLSLVLSACKRTARASTGWEQEDPLKHRARSVPRTRTRLLRVVFKPTAGVMWAILGPTEARAQRVWQESTRHQQDRPIARTAGQGRILQQ